MDVLGLLDWYVANVDKIMPIAITIVIVGGYIGLSEFFDDRLTRTALVIPPALLLLFLSYSGGSAFQDEFFMNVATQMLTALVALLIAFFARTLQEWGLTLAFTALIAVIFVLVADPNAPRTNFLINMGTGLIGAFLITRLQHEEWKWSPSGRDRELWQSVRQRRKQQAQELGDFGDYYILLMGTDELELQQKIDFLLEHDLEITHDVPAETDPETGYMYRMVHMHVKTIVRDPDTVFLSNREARIRILAFPDTVKKVYKQMQEVLELDQPRRVESQPEMVEIEMKATAPQRYFSDYLETQIFDLAREWRASGDEHLDYAATALVDWARDMHFIKD